MWILKCKINKSYSGRYVDDELEYLKILQFNFFEDSGFSEVPLNDAMSKPEKTKFEQVQTKFGQILNNFLLDDKVENKANKN